MSGSGACFLVISWCSAKRPAKAKASSRGRSSGRDMSGLQSSNFTEMLCD